MITHVYHCLPLAFPGFSPHRVSVKPIPLEDNFTDVVGKAQRGLQINDEQLASKAGVSAADIARVKEGDPDEQVLKKIAPVLNLAAAPLVALAKKSWFPSGPAEVPGLACFNTAYGDMTVNSYLVWDTKTSQGVCFDSGADASEMAKFAASKQIRIQLILLTHTHPDHVADLARLSKVTQAKAYVCKLEAIDGAEGFDTGKTFTVGPLKIETRQTKGHSRGGITYLVSGLPNRIAVVGDAMFAGSMGGGGVSYADALKTNRENILTLPDDTILCPGHGPLTTVGQEKVNNPFFP